MVARSLRPLPIMHRRRTALLIATVLSIVMVCVHIACAPDPSGKEPDTDGDGLSDKEELTVYGTSPLLADSDGDGISDYDEIIKFGFDPEHDPYSFNPRIADIPQLTLTIAGPPVLTIQITDENGVTTTFETSQADGVTQSFTNGVTTTQARSDSLTTSITRAHEESVSFTLGGRVLADAGLPDAEPVPPEVDAGVPGPIAGTTDQGSGDSPTITLTDAISTTVSPTTTFATSIELNQQEQIAYSRVLTATQSYAQSHNISALGAFLKVTTILQNHSRVGFRVTNLSLGVVIDTGPGGLIPVQNLNIDQGIITNFIPFSLGPGEKSGPTIFVSPLLTLEAAQAVLANAQAIIIRVATYELVDGAGKPFAVNATEVAAKTALVVIDYGHGRLPEIYQVATKLDPAHTGVSAFKVFHDILRIPYEASQSSGLQSVRDTSATWRVERRQKVGPDTTETRYGENGEPYDFDAIELKSGDTLYLAAVGPAGEEPQIPERNPALTQGGTDAGVEVKGPGGGPADASTPQPSQPNPSLSHGPAPDGG